MTGIRRQIMIRRIIEINEEKCNGCGACANACHEGAIAMVDGKAKLMRDDYCDGLGDCLPNCPTGAISFVEREAAEYDEAAVLANKQKKAGGTFVHAGCPGQRIVDFERSKGVGTENDDGAEKHIHDALKAFEESKGVGTEAIGKLKEVLAGFERSKGVDAEAAAKAADSKQVSKLAQWPCQIKLVPVNAPYFDKAKLLIAADCTAYAYARMHEEFMNGKVTLIGCPKLDGADYSEKLCEIIRSNDIKSVTVVRMEVPCCGGLEHAAVEALKKSGKFIPWQVVTISIDGRILDR